MSDEDDPPAKTISETLRRGRRQLATAGSTTPGLDAEVLLRHVLGIDRTELFSRLPEPITAGNLAAFNRLLLQRAGRTPIAYLTGGREFMGLAFTVDPGVLVPRPETELLVEWAVSWLHGRNHDPVTVVDVGTGSGAIAISIAAAMAPDWPGHIIACDLSAEALSVAARNRVRLDLHQRVALVQGSLISWLRGPVDLLLANLPYLRPVQLAENPFLIAEPRLALDGGPEGIDLIRGLLDDAPRVLAPGGAVGLEIDPGQRGEVVDMARRAFPASVVHVQRDLAGMDRHVIIQTESGCR